MYSKLYRGLSFKFFPFYLKIFAHVKVEFTPHQKVNVCLNYMFYLMWRRQSYRFLATKRDHFLFVWFFLEEHHTTYYYYYYATGTSLHGRIFLPEISSIWANTWIFWMTMLRRHPVNPSSKWPRVTSSIEPRPFEPPKN